MPFRDFTLEEYKALKNILISHKIDCSDLDRLILDYEKTVSYPFGPDCPVLVYSFDQLGRPLHRSPFLYLDVNKRYVMRIPIEEVPLFVNSNTTTWDAPVAAWRFAIGR